MCVFVCVCLVEARVVLFVVCGCVCFCVFGMLLTDLSMCDWLCLFVRVLCVVVFRLVDCVCSCLWLVGCLCFYMLCFAFFAFC